MIDFSFHCSFKLGGCVAIRDTSLGIGPILLGRIFDYVLQPSFSLVTRHVLTYTSCIYTCLSTP
jgi:hypothetical protein